MTLVDVKYFTLSDRGVMCVPAYLVNVLKMFMDKEYRVEAIKTRDCYLR